MLSIHSTDIYESNTTLQSTAANISFCRQLLPCDAQVAGKCGIAESTRSSQCSQ